MRYGISTVAQQFKDMAHVEMSVRIVRLERNGLFVSRLGFRKPSGFFECMPVLNPYLGGLWFQCQVSFIMTTRALPVRAIPCGIALRTNFCCFLRTWPKNRKQDLTLRRR